MAFSDWMIGSQGGTASDPVGIGDVAQAASFALPGMGSFVQPLISLGAGMLSSSSARSANDQNRLTALYQMQFQKDEAQKAREWDATQNWSAIGWQEKMANTAYQRQVADMKAAGLNPILAATKGGGAPTPGASGGGSHGSPQGASYRADPVYNAQLAQLSASAMQIAAQTKLLEAETRKTNVEADNLALQPEYIRSQILRETASAGAATATEAQIRQEMQSFGPRMEKLGHEIQLVKNEAGIKGWETVTAEAESRIRSMLATKDFATLNSQIQAIHAEAVKLGAEARLRGLEIPEALNNAIRQGDWWKKVITPYLPDIGKVTGAVGTATGAAVGAAVGARSGRSIGRR